MKSKLIKIEAMGKQLQIPTTEKQYVLVWRRGGQNQVVFTGSVELCQKKRSKLKKEQQYKEGELMLRTKRGFERYPDWTSRKK